MGSKEEMRHIHLSCHTAVSNFSCQNTKPLHTLKYCSECSTRNIAQWHGPEANIDEAKPSAIFASRPHPRAIFSVAHVCKQYFNWFIATSTECFFRCYIVQWIIYSTTCGKQRILRPFHLLWLHMISIGYTPGQRDRRPAISRGKVSA